MTQKNKITNLIETKHGKSSFSCKNMETRETTCPPSPLRRRMSVKHPFVCLSRQRALSSLFSSKWVFQLVVVGNDDVDGDGKSCSKITRFHSLCVCPSGCSTLSIDIGVYFTFFFVDILFQTRFEQQNSNTNNDNDNTKETFSWK